MIRVVQLIIVLLGYIGECYRLPLQAYHHRRGASSNVHDCMQNDILFVDDALLLLKSYNDEYLNRMRRGRNEGKTPRTIEFERAQTLKSDGIKQEWQQLRESTQLIRSNATEIVLGIMVESGTKGIEVLKNWVSGLNITRGILRAVNENNEVIELEQLQSVPIYIKYNSSDNGNAYMKQYDGVFSGVIFQPKLSGYSDFYQFGNLPIGIFK